MMDPYAGQALQAKRNGRTGLWVHGGDPTGMNGQFLRVTLGCIRVTNADQLKLSELIGEQPCDVRVWREV